MLTKEELPACPVATTVQMIGSKWKLLIMRNLLQRPWRFNELKKDLEGISQKVLTDSLRSMEAAPGRIRPVPPGRIHAAHYGCNGELGHCIQSQPIIFGWIPISGLSGGGIHPIFCRFILAG